MENLLKWLNILLCLSLTVTCEYNSVLFSEYSTKGIPNSSTIVNLQSLSFHKCAAFCAQELCCRGYLYHKNSKLCFQEMMVSPREGNWSPMVLLPDVGEIKRFRKGNIICIPVLYSFSVLYVTHYLIFTVQSSSLRGRRNDSSYSNNKLSPQM
jgi:hypothetical protein